MSRTTWILIGVGALVLATMAVVGGWLALRFVDYPVVARRADEAERAARAAGLAWTAADFAPARPLPDAVNAAGPLARLMEAERGTWRAADVVLWNAAETRALTAYMARVEPMIEPMEAFAASQGLWVQRDIDVGLMMDLSDINAIRRGASALAARANLRIVRGEAEGALADIERILDVAKLVATDQSLLALLGASLIRGVAHTVAQRYVARWPNSPANLARLDATLSRSRLKIDLRPAFRFETYLVMATLRNLEASDDIRALTRRDGRGGAPQATAAIPLRRAGWPDSTFARAMMVRLLETATAAYRAASVQQDDLLAQGKALGRASAELQTGSGLATRTVSVFVPNFSQTAIGVATWQALEGATRGLTRLALARAKSGVWPKTLREAGFDEEDPWGDVYRLKRDGEDVRVYSLGADRKDDHGVSRQEVDAKRRQRGMPALERGRVMGFDVVARYPYAGEATR